MKAFRRDLVTDTASYRNASLYIKMLLINTVAYRLRLGVSIYKSVTDYQITVGQPRGTNSMPRTVFILSNFFHLRVFFQRCFTG